MTRALKGLVYGQDFRFRPGTVFIENGMIREIREEAVSPEEQEKLPYLIPGLVDIHFHGCMGMDFCDGTQEAIETIAAWEAAQGVTSICPATLTLPEEELLRILGEGAKFARRQKARRENGSPAGAYPRAFADLVGINMEGPFISCTKKGAQNEAYIRPCSAALCREFAEASEGLVKIVGLAPEENPDFAAYIGEVKDVVKVSLAHTNADYVTAMQAFAAGASHAVHLFNAMPEMTHREPGVVGAVMDSPYVTAELICDGNHVHPAAVRAAFALLGEERIVLISDSLRAAGMGDGEMLLGGQKVIVNGTRAVLAEGGALAGSVTSLMGCLQTVVKKMGIPLETAVRCASYNPAQAIGAGDRCGSLAPGRRADLVMLGRDLNVLQVWKDGEPVPLSRR